MFAACSASIRACCRGEVTDGEEREKEEESFSDGVERHEFENVDGGEW